MDLQHIIGKQADGGDPFTYVMSDDSVDRMGDIIEPDGWELKAFRKNPIALFGHNSGQPIGVWKNVRVEGKRLLGQLQLAAKGTSDFIDTLHSLIEQRILRAVSVGFLPLEHKALDPDDPWGGYRFTKQQLMECSLVSVPANPNALALAKGLTFSDRRKLFTETGALTARRSIPAETGDRTRATGRASMTLAERIRAKQQELIAAKDILVPLAKKIEAEEALTDEEQTAFDEGTLEIEAVERSLDQLRKAERTLAVRGSTPTGELAAVTRASVTGQNRPSNEKPRDLLFKLGVCHLVAHVQRRQVEDVVAERYPSRDDLDAVIKATTNPAMTTVAGWAAELVETAIGDFVDALPRDSIYPQLSGLGIRVNFDRNGVIKLPYRAGSGTGAPGDLRGAFVGEGAPIPVRRGNLSSLNLYPHKMGVISTFTKEMAQQSTPAIESIIRQGIVEDTAIAIDTALLDALPATPVRPAGLLNGVSVAAGAAATTYPYEAFLKDVSTLLAPFVTAGASSGVVLLVNPTEARAIGMFMSPMGTFMFPNGVPNTQILVGSSVPTRTMIAVRAADFATALGDTPEWDISDTAVVHEDDGTYAADQTVTQPAATVKPIVGGILATPVPAFPSRSLWQTASLGVRMLLPMTWGLRRAGMVSAVNTVSWSA